MAAYAALVSLMNNMEQIKNHPRLSTWFDKNQLESLGKNVEFLLDFIEKYISHGGNADFESRIASAAYEAEDLIEFHIVDQIPTEKSPNFLLDLQKVIEDMDCIKENAIKLQEERGLKDEQPTYSIPATSSSRPLTKTRMVGFDEELIQLLDVLTGEPSSQQIISVAGMGGIGKSTLVRNVYENSVIKEHFDVLAWATISQKHSETQILIDLLSSIEKRTTSKTVQMLGEVLHKSLWNRRYLIILDDMWSVEVWDEIRFYFPENINGSRIVITTRLSNVATLCNSFCLRLNFLDKDKSWNLFCEMVFGCEDWPLELKRVGYEDLPLELKMVGEEIVELCKGLPLSIAVIGGLIRRSCKTVEYWKNVAGDLNSLILSSEENEHCFNIFIFEL